jgi:HNH/ENDO VII superfamily nuclease
VAVSGYTVQFDTFKNAGKGIAAAGDTLALAVDTLCRDLAAAGQAWGQDDIGRAFFTGDDQAMGFGAVRDVVLAALADMVNLLRATGGTLIVNGRNYQLAENASTVGAALPDGADQGAQAGENPYSLPAVTAGLARSDPPPPAVHQLIGLVEELVGGCEYPDGDMAGLKSIEAACTTAASSVLDVARDVDGHSRTVTANNAGEAVERFGSFAAALRGGGEEGGLLWLAGMCQALGDSAGFLVKQKKAARLQFDLSFAFLVATWTAAMAISWMTAGTSVAEANAVTVAEGSMLKSLLARTVTAVRGIWKAVAAGMGFAGVMDGIGQYARIHEGVQRNFDRGEFLTALGEGAVAGGVMGGAGLVIAGRGTRLTAALADRMSANGGNAILTRMGVAAVTGTAGNVAAQGLVEHRVDLVQAAEFGVGMAAMGAAGEHLLGQHGGAAPAAFSRSRLDAAPYEAGEAPVADVPVIGSGEQAGQGGVPAADVPVTSAAYGHEGAAVGDPATTALAADQAPAVGGHAAPGGQGQGSSLGGTDIGRINGLINLPPHGSGDAVPVQTVAAHGTGVPAEGLAPKGTLPSGTSAAYGNPGTSSTTSAGADRPALGKNASVPVSRDPGRPASGQGTAEMSLAGERSGDPVSPVARGSGRPDSLPTYGLGEPPADRPPVVLDRSGGPETLLRPASAGAPVEVPVTPGDAGRAQPGGTAPHGAPDMTAPRVDHPATETGPGTRTDAPGLDSGSRTPVAHEATPPRSLDLNPDTRTPLIPDTVIAGEAPHASEWAHLRESATAVPLQREIHPFTDASRVEVRRMTLAGEGETPRTVTEFTVRLRYQADPAMTPADVVRAKSNILDAVDVHFNHKYRASDRSWLHLRTEFEEVPASATEGAASPQVVRLHLGDGMGPGERPDMLNLYADMNPAVTAHELGHHLDLRNEYPDPGRTGGGSLTAPGVHRDLGLMGSVFRFWADHTAVVDHLGNPVPAHVSLRDRNLEQLEKFAGHPPEVRGEPGPRVPGETPRTREEVTPELPDHERDLLTRLDEDGHPVFPAEGRDPLDHAMLVDRTHAVFEGEVAPERLTRDHMRYTEELTDAARELYDTARDYSFRAADLRGLRELADIVGAAPEGVMPRADLLRDVAHETLGHPPAPHEIEALTRLADHLNNAMDGRRPFEPSADALHRAAADRLGTTPSPETTRRAIDELTESLPLAHPGENPVPRAEYSPRSRQERVNLTNASVRDFEARYGRLSRDERLKLAREIYNSFEPPIKGTDRPHISQATRAEIFKRAQRDRDGNIISATTGKPIPAGDVHKGHVDGNEHRKLVADANRLGMNEAMFRAAMQNADLYRLEKGSGPDGNSAHRHEDKSSSPSELFKDAKRLRDGSILVRGVRILRNGMALDAKTGKAIRAADLPRAWETKSSSVQGQATKAADKAAKQQEAALDERQQWLEQTSQQAKLNRAQRQALEAQQKANEAAEKAQKAMFWKKTTADEAAKAAAKAQQAYEKANPKRKHK